MIQGMRVIDWLLPVRCPACGVPGPAPCPDCEAAWPLAGPGIPDGLDRFVALGAHAGVARSAMHSWKYRFNRDGLAGVGRGLGIAVLDTGERVDVLTWVPCSAATLRRRGADPGAELATAAGAVLQLAPTALLQRRHSSGQTGRSREERAGQAGFAARRTIEGTVLIIDDVCTTGASLTAAATVLRAAGASRVVAAVVGRTPIHARADVRDVPVTNGR